MNDRQRLIFWLLFLFAVLLTVAWLAASIMATPAYACHKYSVWNYPWAQRCPTRVAQTEAPQPPPKPLDYYNQTEAPTDIPLPSLEGMEFPPDCLADWCQRMKGIGLLREKFGTN